MTHRPSFVMHRVQNVHMSNSARTFGELFHNFGELFHIFQELFHNFGELFYNFGELFNNFGELFHIIGELFNNFGELLTNWVLTILEDLVNFGQFLGHFASFCLTGF